MVSKVYVWCREIVEYRTNHHDQKFLWTTSRRIGVWCSLPRMIESISKVNESLPPEDSKEHAIETPCTRMTRFPGVVDLLISIFILFFMLLNFVQFCNASWLCKKSIDLYTPTTLSKTTHPLQGYSTRTPEYRWQTLMVVWTDFEKSLGFCLI